MATSGPDPVTAALVARQPEQQHWWSPIVEALTGGPSWSDQASQLRTLQQQHAPLEQRMALASGLLGGFGGSIKGVGEAAHVPLDLSTEARMARARAQGFNVDQPVYHGTGRDFSSFQLGAPETTHGGLNQSAVHLSVDPDIAASYAEHVKLPWRQNIDENWAPNVHKAVLRDPNQLTLSHDDFFLLKGGGDPSKRTGYEKNVRWPALQKWWQTKFGEPIDPNRSAFDQLKDKGFSSVGTDNGSEVAIFDPANIRSVHAKFDPAKARSADLLAGIGGAGVAAALAARQQP